MEVEGQQVHITVRGGLGPTWQDWFAGLQITAQENGDTVLAGVLPDQAALHGVLERLRDLNIDLVAVLCQ